MLSPAMVIGLALMAAWQAAVDPYSTNAQFCGVVSGIFRMCLAALLPYLGAVDVKVDKLAVRA